jgi:hypothetical protein
LQGSSCGEQVNIFDIAEPVIDWRWVYTAFTRCTTLQVKFFTGRLRREERNRRALLEYWHENSKLLQSGLGPI